MATYTRPTFSEILARIQADLNSNLSGVDSRLRRSVLNVLSYMLAGASHGLYGFISFIAVQLFPDTAETDYLNRWASIFGVTRTASTSATGVVGFTGVDTTVIPSGTQLQRSDLAVFTTNTTVTIASGIASVAVTAVVPGSAGNTVAASEFTFISPISGADSIATVDGLGLSGGNDLEGDDSLRARLLERIQAPPQGGAESDYVAWALEVTGVTRAWCYPQGGGSPNVSVLFMMDNTYSDGIPLSGDVTTVQNYMNALIPVTAVLTVSAPIPTPVNFTIELIDEDTADIRASVEANLAAMITRDSSPAGTIYLSRIVETVSLSDGVFAANVSVPATNVTISSGYIATMGTVTWV